MNIQIATILPSSIQNSPTVILCCHILIPARATGTSRKFLTTVFLLPNAEWYILVLDHVCNLTSHRHDEKHEPVKEQYGPKDGNIEHGEEGHEECY